MESKTGESSMSVISIHDKEQLETFFRTNTDLHIYSIGDLDDFFWPHTVWYGNMKDEKLTAVALLYIAQTIPALLALSDTSEPLFELLHSIAHLLPDRFYAHLSPGAQKSFGSGFVLSLASTSCKMSLKNSSALEKVDCSDVERLSVGDLPQICRLFKESYPDNWFDKRMLLTNQYFGIRQNDNLVSVAGVHVYSEKYRIAALGNIATHPSLRNRGYGKKVTARLCQSLLEKVDTVGLNAGSENMAALRCYEQLGFETVVSYNEFMVRRKEPLNT